MSRVDAGNDDDSEMNQRAVTSVCALILTFVASSAGCGGGGDTAHMTELQRVRSGTLDVSLLSPHESLHHGRDTFVIEFKSTSGGNLVDVGDVRATASMPMPGMAMFGNIEVRRTDTPGRYDASGEFEMAGTWRLTLEWDGSAGKGSIAFSGTVQ